MPIYEFVCESCGKPFEELVRSYGAIAEVHCPHCGSERLRRKMSVFASRTSGSSGRSEGAPACTGGGT